MVMEDKIEVSAIDVANAVAKQIIEHGQRGENFVPDTMELLNTVQALVVSNVLDFQQDGKNTARADRMFDLSALNAKNLFRRLVARVVS